MKRYFHKSADTGSVNITSLIDVVFMLVIFFMIGSSFEKAAVPISLPASSTAEEQDAESLSLTLTIDRSGALYLNNRAVDEADLAEEAARLLAGMEDKQVVLYSDESVPLGRMVRVIDELNKGGVEGVAIKTRPAQ